jgi:hypothetical protein
MRIGPKILGIQIEVTGIDTVEEDKSERIIRNRISDVKTPPLKENFRVHLFNASAFFTLRASQYCLVG